MNGNNGQSGNWLVRGAIDLVCGNPKPWGWLGVTIMLLASVALISAYLTGGYFAAGLFSYDRSDAPPLSALVILAVVVLVIVALLVIGLLWLIRRYYRLMYGSAYHHR